MSWKTQRKRWQKLLQVNKAGRRLINTPNIPLDEFVEVLVKNQNETDLLFHLFRERPDLLKLDTNNKEAAAEC
jgi:hypothetical protein